MLVDDLDGYPLIRFRNLYYLCAHPAFPDPVREGDLENLHVLDGVEKWQSLRSRASIPALLAQSYRIRDLVNDVCIVRAADGNYRAFRIEADAMPSESLAGSASLSDVRRGVVTAEVLGSMMIGQSAKKLDKCVDKSLGLNNRICY